MKLNPLKFSVSAFILFSSLFLSHTRGDDFCSNATILVIDAPCTNAITDGGTRESGETDGSCWTTFGPTSYSQTVWFRFTASRPELYIDFSFVSGDCYPSYAVYGPFSSGNGCVPAVADQKYCMNNTGIREITNLTGLSVGMDYLIQVGALTAGPCGNKGVGFCISINIPDDPCNSCGSPCGPAKAYPVPPTFAQLQSDGACYDKKSPDRFVSRCYTIDFAGANGNLELNLGFEGWNCSGNGWNPLDFRLYDASCSQLGIGTNYTGISPGNYIMCIDATNTLCEGVNSLCPWYTQNIATPVQFGSFTAALKDQGVELDWTTLQEIGHDYFSVEYSSDAEEFLEIARLPGSGLAEGGSYTYLHHNLNQGMSFYRIIQIDKDGQYSESETVEVNRVIQEHFALLTPVPSLLHDNFFLQLSCEETTEISVQILDALGRLVYVVRKYFPQNNGSLVLPFSRISNGVYFLSISSSRKEVIQKIIKL